jgi:predicted nucleotidyltransferase component of viral defense system
MAQKEVIDFQKILTKEQEKFLDHLGGEPYFRSRYYFTGGTPLSAFYLQHRLSEDLDLFSEKEVHVPSARKFLKKIEKPLGIKKIDYRQFLGFHSFQLYFSETNILKVDFNYYPFPRIEKGMRYKNIVVDSVFDIAVNKIHTIATQPRARDFIDVYFIIKKFGYTLQDLLEKAKAKFDWHIDPLQLGSRLYLAKDTKDFPRMIKKIRHEEWQNFFMDEAKKLKPDIIA